MPQVAAFSVVGYKSDLPGIIHLKWNVGDMVSRLVQIGKARSSLLSVLSLGLLLSLDSVSQAASKIEVRGASNVPAGIEVYSNMNFIEDEREYSGDQIVIISYFDSEKRDWKKKVLWRSAGPFLDPPVLLDAVVAGKNLSVVLPEGYDEGRTARTWTLSLQGDKIVATPNNGGHGFTLKKLTVK